MIKETVSIAKKETKLSVVNNKIEAVLKSNDTKTGLRIYKDGCIGIASAIGSFDEKLLKQKAENMLKYKVGYDFDPTENAVKSMDLSQKCGLTEEAFIQTSTALLEALQQNHPSFSYSNIIRMVEEEITIKNELGTNLTYKDKSVCMELLIKYKGSSNIIDGFAVLQTRNFDFEDAYHVATEFCNGYEELMELESDCKMPVVFLNEAELLFGKFYTDLNGERYGTKTSLFSDKIGEKLFSGNFSLFANRNSEETYESFFDGEGTTLTGDRFALIENGVLKSPYSAKKVAKKYKLPLTASASMHYDDVPNMDAPSFQVESSGKTIKELLNGRKAVYVVMASGGDFTPQGEYASPVQTAYLFDGEKIYGRLPQLSISSNIYDMFGKDFIGMSTDGNSINSPEKYMVLEMNVKKIDRHL